MADEVDDTFDKLKTGAKAVAKKSHRSKQGFR